MNYRILKLVALLLVIVFVASSCGEGRWRRYKDSSHYVHKKNYRKYHEHHNRDW